MGAAVTAIRALQRGDLPAVTQLYETVFRAGMAAKPGLAEEFERTVLDYPWADPGIPSLVYEQPDGAISGFLGSHVRAAPALRPRARVPQGPAPDRFPHRTPANGQRQARSPCPPPRGPRARRVARSYTGAMVRSVLRFVGSVLTVSGLLMLSDAGATLLWQEPVSWLIAQRQQDQLEEAFAKPPKRVLAKRPLPGDSIGRISLPSLDRRYFVVEGTGTEDLRKGPGHYPDTPLPGQRGTVAIAGHRTTYGAPFRTIDQLKRGDRIKVEMPYGTFVYRVQKTKIVEPTDLSVLRKVGYNRLILSACHPLYSAAQRIIAFARLQKRGDRSTVK